MKTLGELMKGRKIALSESDQKNITEYSDTVNRAAKLIGSPYIVLHKRLEKAFAKSSFQSLMGYLRRWLHEAEKSDKPAVTFNWRFKQFREAQKTL